MYYYDGINGMKRLCNMITSTKPSKQLTVHGAQWCLEWFQVGSLRPAYQIVLLIGLAWLSASHFGKPLSPLDRA